MDARTAPPRLMPRGRGRGLRSSRSAPARRGVAIARCGGLARPRSPARESPGAQRANSRCQLLTSGLGQTKSTLSQFAAAEQQADGHDRLHSLAQAHLVGQNRRLTRIKKGNALELKWKGLQRHAQRPLGQQRFQRRLQEIMQPVFQLDHVLGRLDSRQPFRANQGGPGRRCRATVPIFGSESLPMASSNGEGNMKLRMRTSAVQIGIEIVRSVSWASSPTV